MTTFVIVHGAWGGGWEWSPVAALLRADGHSVWTPTLTGLGERSHVGRDARIGLDVHVRDVVSLLEFEDLRDVVLCVASYAGMTAPGIAAGVGCRLRSLVYVDALVPVAGASALDMFPPGFAAVVRTGLAEHGPTWRVPLPADLLAQLVPPERSWYRDRLRDHPAATFADVITSTDAVDGVPRAFLRCTASELTEDPIEPCAAAAREGGWVYRELDAPHDPHLFAPEATADAIADLGHS